MRRVEMLAIGMLALAAAYGCHSASEEEPLPNTEDQLVGFKGNVDHASIVEATTIMLTTADIAVLDPNLDSYNQEDPFAVRRSSYEGTFAKNLAKFDAIDGKTDWTPERTAKWLTRMASSYQVVDTSKPCEASNPHTYLEIERAMLTGKAHTTCGGRMPNEDALDVTMNFLARGPEASVDDEDAIHDGVEQATKKSSDSFPFLAEPNE